MDKRYTKEELKRIMRKFLQDEHRGISQKLFAELAGISLTTLRNVFVNETESLSDMVQMRVTRAYQHVLYGRVKIMSHKNVRSVEYRKEPQLRLRRHTGLTLTPEGFKIQTGIRLKHDYSTVTLDEQLRKKDGSRT
ncbi:MAG: hypothetical protein EBR82_32415 [Caulobacteraceae bacterium]|nr:hypothetical protein [Caulobacteraceae bacterium]NDG19502.1 hypothetical protein [Betaproteobacteria bacterium]